jgi:type II secretory pathway pseudopilin PulG
MTTRRPALSLFEILIVLALLAILLGLLFPVIFKIRVAAARSQSANNLKQMALACHNYHDANAAFPAGSDDNNFSAAARLLPYVEQDNLYKQIDFTKPSTDPANAVARGALVKVFINPRDPQMGSEPGVAPTNYLFNAGSEPALKDNNGVFYQDSKVKLADITDGTSNTLMIGETLKGDGGKTAKEVARQYVLLGKDALKKLGDESGEKEWKDNKHIAGDRCASWIEGRFLQGTFTGTRLANDARPDVSCDGQGGLSGLRSLDGSITFALCDGSVRTVSKDLPLETWKALCGRNDGQIIPNF